MSDASPSKDKDATRPASLLRASAGGSSSKMPAARATISEIGAVRRLLRVREAATPQHPRPAAFELRGRLSAESRLPDAGWSDHGDQMRLVPRDDPLPGIADDLQLPSPTDERGPREPSGGRLHHGRTSQPGAQGLALALRSDRVDLVVGEDALREPMGLLADDDTSGGRGRLQPGGGVHDVAGRERLPGRRVERDDGFARAHRGPNPEAELRDGSGSAPRSLRERRARRERRVRRHRREPGALRTPPSPRRR